MATGYSVGNLELSIQTVGNGAVTSLTLTNAQLKQMLRLLGGNNSQLGKMGGNFNKTFNFAKMLGKIYFIRNYTKQMAQSLVKIVEAGSDYTETLNLWSVAMGSNISQAEIFINKMQQAYGISETALMNYQAIFKNMLGSLGEITDAMAYGMSEGITQMALDYASLYNVSIEKAMTTFQSVLSGQVRPIRSIAGYDITETTIFSLYERLGGQKTMRQLTQTEKRLLRILAVFEQMDASGAIGDMQKTITSFANQSRIMSEGFERTKTYLGLIIVDLLETSGIMHGINSVLTFTAEFFKGVATAMGAIKKYGDPFATTTEGAENANKATEELKGKLLGFDQFRALNPASDTEENLGLDEKIMSAFGNFTSILDGADGPLSDIVAKFLSIIGLEKDTETGAIKISERFKGITSILGIALSTLSGIGLTLVGKSFITVFRKIANSAGITGTAIKKAFSLKNIGIMAIVSSFIYLYQSNEDFRESINKLLSAILSLVIDGIEPFAKIAGVLGTALAKILDIATPILTKIIDIATWIIELVDNLNILEPLIYIILAYKTVGWLTSTYTALIPLIAKTQMFVGVLFSAIKTQGLGTLLSKLFTSLKNGVISATKSIGAFLGTTQGLIAGISILIIGVSSFISNFDKLSTSARIWIPILASLAGAITAVAAGLTFLKGNWVGAISLGAMVAGAGIMVGTALATPKQYKNGGLVEDGLFTMNKGEVMGTFDDGTSIVANNQQIISGIKQGVYQAVSQAMANSGRTDDRPIDVYIDGEKVFQATKKNAKRHGLAFSKV